MDFCIHQKGYSVHSIFNNIFRATTGIALLSISITGHTAGLLLPMKCYATISPSFLKGALSVEDKA